MRNVRNISLAVILLGFWLALSGHYTPFLITVGIIASLLIVALSVHMHVVDAEGHPTQLFRPALTYWPWLGWEMIKSSWAVTKIVLDPKLPISPTMTVVKASQRTAGGLATYGNSITLTPGTVTTDIKGNIFTVHALVRDGALDVEAGGMDARVRQFEGGA
ncbi:MAG: Na+/H+ antiporter subunit E [Hyphomicrobiaceae bacterium]